MYQALAFSEDGTLISPTLAPGQQLNPGLHKEDFREHNLIWTQWKKMRHFHHLKPGTDEKQTLP